MMTVFKQQKQKSKYPDLLLCSHGPDRFQINNPKPEFSFSVGSLASLCVNSLKSSICLRSDEVI